jgi:ATP-dependent Clp protease ATP-binding subunit ClpC
VEAVLDLVTLIKAGVTDPGKPFAVFLFVGPTGVGKTELARALAEFIFGDASRLKRFDMSEFANMDGFTRLIGGRRENGLLTDAVRQHPFSVVLLDEIEKGHPNVFDLCLQIFDAGRLTDGRGRTVDFRRTIVILTSNIGATAGSTPLGFVNSAERSVLEVDKDRTFRELSRFFRPEFLNRLDRIIQFRPLSLQVAEQIARREVDLVLHRSGIRRRHLVVDIDPEVVSLLVREGYSPHFGARPLKRTVERLLLLPLARAISSGSLRGRTVLRLTERQGRVEAIVSAPPAGKEKQSPEPPQPDASLGERLGELQRLHAELNHALQPLADRKSELILQTQQPNFFRNPDARSATLGEIHNLDQFLHLNEGVGKALAGLEERFHRGAVAKSEEGALHEKFDRLAAEIAHLKFVSRCKNSRDLGEALITLSLLDRTGSPQDAVPRLAGMYQALAARRRMTAEVLGEFYDDKRDRVWLLVAGLGSYALLKQEAGLHQVDRRFKERTPRAGREAIREDRELVRVEVHSAGTEPSKHLRQTVKTKITVMKPPRKRLLKADLALSLFDEQAVRSVEFWTSGPKNEALERALIVLQACATPDPKSVSHDAIIRHYDVGLSPRVKDTRSGRTTTRVDRVMKGELGLFLETNGEQPKQEQK